jgi:hypothetical protein
MLWKAQIAFHRRYNERKEVGVGQSYPVRVAERMVFGEIRHVESGECREPGAPVIIFAQAYKYLGSDAKD